MVPSMSIIICLIVALLLSYGVLRVAQAILSLPRAATFAPYGDVIYALIVLLIILVIIDICFGYKF